MATRFTSVTSFRFTRLTGISWFCMLCVTFFSFMQLLLLSTATKNNLNLSQILTNLIFFALHSSEAAVKMIRSHDDLKQRWKSAVQWLGDELERVHLYFLSFSEVFCAFSRTSSNFFSISALCM